MVLTMRVPYDTERNVEVVNYSLSSGPGQTRSALHNVFCGLDGSLCGVWKCAAVLGG